MQTALPALMPLTPSFWWGALRLAGRAHVIVVHFPIALLISAAWAELWAALRTHPAPSAAVRFCLWMGAVSAVVAGGVGWIHARDGFAGPLTSPMTITGLHRWIGTATVMLAGSVVWLAERDSRRGQRTVVVRGAIFVLAAMVGIAAHFGGLLTHGADFFDL